MQKHSCIDLFAGAGGFSAGFVKEGFEVVFATDNFPKAASSYKKNHKEAKFIEADIRKLTGAVILDILNMDKGEVDVLLGGPPCQGFSTVGERKTKDERNKLFREYVRLVNFIQPGIFIMENVTGILNLEGGAFVKRILKYFKDIKYKTKCKTLNAVDFGVPQNRERVFILGGKEGRDVCFPEPPRSKATLTLWDAISDLPKLRAGEKEVRYTHEPKNRYQKERRKGSDELTLHEAANHNEKTVEMMKYIPEGESVWNTDDIPNRLMPSSGYRNTYARLDSKAPGMTVTRNFSCVSSSRCIHPFQNRGLTAREAARIQSFDDDYVFEGNKSEIALQIGNAVPPLLAKKLAKMIKNRLLEEEVVK